MGRPRKARRSSSQRRLSGPACFTGSPTIFGQLETSPAHSEKTESATVPRLSQWTDEYADGLQEGDFDDLNLVPELAEEHSKTTAATFAWSDAGSSVHHRSSPLGQQPTPGKNIWEFGDNSEKSDIPDTAPFSDTIGKTKAKEIDFSETATTAPS